MKDKKLRLEQSLYKWLDAVDEVEEDISSLVDGHNISKSKIMIDILIVIILLFTNDRAAMA